MGEGVFVVMLNKCIPFMNALSQLSQISNYANVKVSPLSFSVIATHPSLGFTATLNFCPQFFNMYAVDNQHYTFRISLESFYNAMFHFGQARDLPSLSITALLLHGLHTFILTFTSPRRRGEVGETTMNLLPSEEEEELEEIDCGKYFSIYSEDFRRILNFQDVSLCVTVNNSQVKFSGASQEVILTKEGGKCEIVGYEEEEETQFKIIHRPLPFFCRLSYNDTERVWFYQTINNSHSVMIFPALIHCLAQYVIYFPKM